MGKHLDILHKLVLDKGINRRERDMLIALKAFDFEDTNVISVGLQTLLDYFCIKNKECIYSVLRTLQFKNYIRIKKKNGMKNVYVIIKDYLLVKDVEDNGYNNVSSYEESRYVDVPSSDEGRYKDVPSTGYADVPGNGEGGYTDVSSYEESRYIDVSSDVSRHVDVSSCDGGRYKDVPSTGYADVSSYAQCSYIGVSGCEESSYTDETGGTSGHADVSSCEEGRYKDVPSTGYADVPGNAQSGYTDVSSYEESSYTNVSSDVSRHVDVPSCDGDRYTDVPSTGYADVPGNGEGGYTGVPCCKESRYTDETSERSGHVDVASWEEDRYKDVPSTRYADVSSDDQGGYDNVSTSHNNIYINNNNKIYINIINHWNSKKIGKGVSLNIKVIDSINKAMSKYSFDEIKKAIDNYAKVYNSDYFYDFQWHLSYFLTRDNAIGKFVDNGEIWMRYKKKYYTLRDEYEEWGINTEDYINSI